MDNPFEVLDRTVTSYTGGINTAEYYAKIYANEQNGVPTETLVIQNPEARNTNQIQTQTQTYYSQPQQPSQYVDPNAPQQPGESPLDYFMRTTNSGSVVGTDRGTSSGGVTAAGTAATVETNQNSSSATQQMQQDKTYTTTVGTNNTVNMSPTGIFGFVVHAAFSIAVVLSVIGVMFIVYVIIRTRQLHHHEHHVKELGGHGGGHGGGHDGHGSDDSHASTHGDAHVAHEHDADEHDDAGEHEESVDSEHSEANEREQAGASAAQAHANTGDEEDYVPIKPVETLDAGEESLFSSRLKTIRDDAAGEDEDAWYTALMDINLLLEDILTEKNYEGATVKEMLASDDAKNLATRDVALEAEAQFQKLISGEEELTKDAITHLVNMYAKVCKELGVV